jgi:hypothetical protein
VPGGSTETVTPSLSGYAFTPTSQTFGDINSNQTASFTASVITIYYTISGYVTLNGAGLPGVTMSLAGSTTGGSTTTNSAGYYSFTVPMGSTETVTPSLSGYTFTPTSQTFSNINNNQTAGFTASIVVSSYTLTVTEVGQGTVTSNDGMINCVNGGGSCSGSYPIGTSVTLNAAAAGDWTFQGWSGACNGSGTCTVVMNSSLTVTATFANTGPSLQEHLMTQTTPTGCSAPPKSTSFLPTTTDAWLWFDVANASTGDQATANWYSPSGSLYTSASWTPVSSPGEWCFWDPLSIAGAPPASQPGTWSVKVYWNSSLLFTLPFTIDYSTAPSLVWMNNATQDVTVNYYGGAGGAVYQGWNWLANPGYPGWRVVGAADFDGDGTPDVVWMNITTRQVTVHYYGGPDGSVYQGWAFLEPIGFPGWHVAALGDFDGNGVPDLVWMNDTTRQVTVHYFGGTNGSTYLGWNWLEINGFPGWTVVGAADFDQNGVPDLIWQNDTTRQVTVHYFGGTGGATDIGWNWLNSGGEPGWTVAGANDFNADGVPDLVWYNQSTGQVSVNYYSGTGGATYIGWNWLNTANNTAWTPFVAQ